MFLLLYFCAVASHTPFQTLKWLIIKLRLWNVNVNVVYSFTWVGMTSR